MGFALITGASKGIGRAIALELAKRGTDLLLVARSEDALKELAEEVKKTSTVRAEYFVLDLSQQDAAVRVRDWCAGNGYEVQYLVNNAGYGLSGSFTSYSLEEQLQMMRLNMDTVVELCYHFLPLLKKQPKGYIMNIASTAAYQAVPYLGIYGATKVFVLNFSRALSYELRETNVSVTCISPGATATNFDARANMGPKALKAAGKVQMQADDVARQAVNGMMSGKREVVLGLVNKVGAFFVWLLPKRLVESTAAKIYH
jgi:short-subunit dehydrogenase